MRLCVLIHNHTITQSRNHAIINTTHPHTNTTHTNIPYNTGARTSKKTRMTLPARTPSRSSLKTPSGRPARRVGLRLMSPSRTPSAIPRQSRQGKQPSSNPDLERSAGCAVDFSVNDTHNTTMANTTATVTPLPTPRRPMPHDTTLRLKISPALSVSTSAASSVIDTPDFGSPLASACHPELPVAGSQLSSRSNSDRKHEPNLSPPALPSRLVGTTPPSLVSVGLSRDGETPADAGHEAKDSPPPAWAIALDAVLSRSPPSPHCAFVPPPRPALSTQGN